jgi:hypothetical protein
MKPIWVVCWRGLEEVCTSPQDAMDRWDRLDAFGIEAAVYEVRGVTGRLGSAPPRVMAGLDPVIQLTPAPPGWPAQGRP